MKGSFATRCLAGILQIFVLVTGAQAAVYDVWLKPFPASDKVCVRGSFTIDTEQVAAGAEESQPVEVLYRVTETAGPCETLGLGDLGLTFTDHAVATLRQKPLPEMAPSKVKRLSGGTIVAFNGAPLEEVGWQTSTTSGSYLLVNSEVVNVPVVATLPLLLFGVLAIYFARVCRRAAKI